MGTEMVIYFTFVAAAAGTSVGTVAWVGWYRRQFKEMAASLGASMFAALPGVALAVESFWRMFPFRPAPIMDSSPVPQLHELVTIAVVMLWILVGFVSLLLAAALRKKPVPWRANALQIVHVVTWFLACITAFMFAMRL